MRGFVDGVGADLNEFLESDDSDVGEGRGLSAQLVRDLVHHYQETQTRTRGFLLQQACKNISFSDNEKKKKQDVLQNSSI